MLGLPKAIKLFAVTVIIGCGLLTGCSTPTPVRSEWEEPIQPASACDMILPGDVLEISLGGAPFTSMTVGKDYQVVLPNGAIIQSPRSSTQLKADIKATYLGHGINPEPIVIGWALVGIVIDGEVKSPGQYRPQGELTLLRAIDLAGGFKKSARKTRVTIVRSNGKKETVNCNKAAHDPSLDLPIYAGDEVLVP